MATREFLHGGYRERNGPVVVLSGGEVAGVWFPGDAAIETQAPSRIIVQSDSGATTVTRAAPAFTPVPKPSKKGRR